MLSTTDIQRAVFEKLSAYEVVIGTVYDHMPDTDEEGFAYPFTVMSDHTAEAWDTDSDEGIDMTITVDTWSRYVGNAEVKSMMDTVRSALSHTELTLTELGLHCVLVEMQREQLLTDPDGLTRHGIQEFRLLVENLD